MSDVFDRASPSGGDNEALLETDLAAAREAAKASDARFRALWDANVVGVAISDERCLLEANDAFLGLIGRSRQTLERGRVFWRNMTPPEWVPTDHHAVEQLLREGHTATYDKEYVHPDGSRVPVLLSLAVLGLEPVRIVALALDNTARRAAEREREILLVREREARREAEQTASRIARLQRVTAALSAATSADAIARLIVESAVEALGASAGTVALHRDGELVLLTAEGFDADSTVGWEHFGLDSPVTLAEAVRTGELVLLPDRDEREARYGTLVGPAAQHEAVAAVPFIFHGKTLGGMGISFREPHDFTEQDRAFLLALGRQCGQALERTRLAEERAYVAQTLQEGLLPDRLAEIPGVEVSVRYHSISGGGSVGGDFYDLFDVSEGRWLAVIGDVCGKGIEAAVLTGLARHTIRAIAMRDPEPEDILTFLNEAMLRQLDDGAYCTVGLTSLRRTADGGLEARLASGGHPYPLLLRRGEKLREIAVPGRLLGFAGQLDPTPVTLALKPGDLLVLYTDGITDARGDGERFGMERLQAVLEAARDGDAGDVADAVDRAVRHHQPGTPRDDRALMILRVAPSDGAAEAAP